MVIVKKLYLQCAQIERHQVVAIEERVVALIVYFHTGTFFVKFNTSFDVLYVPQICKTYKP